MDWLASQFFYSSLNIKVMWLKLSWSIIPPASYLVVIHSKKVLLMDKEELKEIVLSQQEVINVFDKKFKQLTNEINDIKKEVADLAEQDKSNLDIIIEHKAEIDVLKEQLIELTKKCNL